MNQCCYSEWDIIFNKFKEENEPEEFLRVMEIVQEVVKGKGDMKVVYEEMMEQESLQGILENEWFWDVKGNQVGLSGVLLEFL